MSRTLFSARAVLSAAALTATLLGTACSDSTAPSTENDSAGGSPKAQAPNSPKDTTASVSDTGISSVPLKPSSLVQQSASGSVGNVAFEQNATSCMSFGPAVRQVTVGGIYVENTRAYSLIPQVVQAEIILLRYNGSSWVPVGPQKVVNSGAALTSTTSYVKTAKLPTVAFQLSSSGHYRVKVLFSWWTVHGPFGMTLVGKKLVDLNSSSDYFPIGQSARGPYYCTIY